MNCEYVDQLPALYVDGDLDKERATLVAAHLQSCTQCAHAANEYAAVNRLLQEFEPPLFSQAVYAGIRRQVLNKIERTSRASAWSSILSNFFGPPRPVTIAAAVLLGILIAASYFVTHKSPLPQSPEQVVAGRRTLDQSSKNSSAGIQLRNQSSSLPSQIPSGHLSSASGAGKRKTVVTHGVSSSYRSRRRSTASADVSQISLAGTPIRMELKTSNPNIRMIWFSSPSQVGSKDRSKGI